VLFYFFFDDFGHGSGHVTWGLIVSQGFKLAIGRDRLDVFCIFADEAAFKVDDALKDSFTVGRGLWLLESYLVYGRTAKPFE